MMNLNTNIWTEEDTTIDFHKPTTEEYNKAKEDMSNFARWIRLSRERQTSLIDELAKERESEKMYLGLYERSKDICRMYEACVEAETKTKDRKKKETNETSSTDKHST